MGCAPLPARTFHLLATLCMGSVHVCCCWHCARPKLRIVSAAWRGSAIGWSPTMAWIHGGNRTSIRSSPQRGPISPRLVFLYWALRSGVPGWDPYPSSSPDLPRKGILFPLAWSAIVVRRRRLVSHRLHHRHRSARASPPSSTRKRLADTTRLEPVVNSKHEPADLERLRKQAWNHETSCLRKT